MANDISVSCPPPSKVRGYPPGETRFAEETYEDIHKHKLIQSVDGQAFIQTYLPGASINPTAWSSEQQLLLHKIKATPQGSEEGLYTAKPPPKGPPDDAPLLRLLGHISKQVPESVHNMVQQVANDVEREVLVFNTGDNCKVYNPFYQQERTPDIIALWEKANHFPEVDCKSKQLFHDAESTFWVIAWTPAQSARPGYQQEPNPHANFRKFFYTMYQHYPTPGDDTRFVLWQSSKDYWKSILHPDLETLGTMLSKMFHYIHPEWAYRQDLNPKHVHEALMRLLLQEIVRIDEDSKDIPLVIALRSKPPPPPGVSALPSSSMNSFSFNTITSYPPTSGIFEHQHKSLGRERSNSVQAPMQPDNSRVPEPRASQLASDSQQPIPELDEVAKHDKEELVRDQLRERARRLEWDREACKLEPPQPQAPKIQTPEQNAPSELS